MHLISTDMRVYVCAQFFGIAFYNHPFGFLIIRVINKQRFIRNAVSTKNQVR